MKKISRYFVSAFNVDEISEKRLYSFASDHLKKLHDLNDHGQFDKLILETQPPIMQMYSLMQKTTVNKKNVSVSSKSMREIYSSFSDIANKFEGMIKAVYGKKSSEYKSVFPKGLTEYTRVNRLCILDLCLRLQFFAHSINGSLPEKLRKEIETFSTILKECLKLHQENNEEKKCLKDLKRVTKNRVSKQLHKNLLIIASGNIEKPDASSIYFDQTLLNR